MACARSKGAAWTRVAAASAALAAAVALAPGSAAQCALCSVAASQSRSPGSINAGILVLLVPTLSIFAGILIRALRTRQ